MQILNDDTKKELLSHYPEKYHELLIKQVLAIQDTIESHFNEYQYSDDFRKAIDILLNEILNGKFLGRDPLEK